MKPNEQYVTMEELTEVIQGIINDVLNPLVKKAMELELRIADLESVIAASVVDQR